MNRMCLKKKIIHFKLTPDLMDKYSPVEMKRIHEELTEVLPEYRVIMSPCEIQFQGDAIILSRENLISCGLTSDSLKNFIAHLEELAVVVIID